MIGIYFIAGGQMIMVFLAAYLMYKETKSWGKEDKNKVKKIVKKKTIKKRR
jgi:hypothetical protein